APDPRLPARRRDPLHTGRRGRRAVGARGLDRPRVETQPDEVPQLRRRHVGAAGRPRAHAPGRPRVAPTLRETSVPEIERRLDELRDGEGAGLRTSVLTHVAWVPPEWARAAGRVLAGMGERVPS